MGAASALLKNGQKIVRPDDRRPHRIKLWLVTWQCRKWVAVRARLRIGQRLILNELLTNCLKYAFPHGRKGHVGVELGYTDEGWAQLRVWDDGQGLPADFDYRQSESMGMTLVHILTRQLRGRLHLKGTAGTEFRIEFPLAIPS